MLPDREETTIGAIATAPGAGGIGIIRLSGPLCRAILEAIFRPHHQGRQPTSHRLTYGWIVDPAGGRPIDEVLAVFMAAPHTYTREDVVEIHCHGSFIALQEILALCFAHGARPAAAGEFTKRAFLNGRIDLTRAEAVLDLLEAKTREGLQIASNQLGGGLYAEVERIRDGLVELRAVLEVVIDFPEDELELLDADALACRLESEVSAPLTALLAAADTGRIFREGISAVILGRPNVGKSSLLNTLLREERALVTPVPGTTRDTIEELVNIKGMPVRLVDTAGIRDTDEVVEGLGIERARAKLAQADLILFLVDATQGVTGDDRRLFETAASHRESTILVVANKIDLAPDFSSADLERSFPGSPVAAISARSGLGIDALEEKIFAAMAGEKMRWDSGSSCAPNLRHKLCLEKALAASRRVEAGLAANAPADLLAVDLQAALDHLADIVGETTTEDVLDVIFSRFCLGK